jgi:hypothetical protein
MFVGLGVSMAQITLTPGDLIEQSIELRFNKKAIERNDTVVFRMKYDSSNFTFTTSPLFPIKDNLLLVPADLYVRTVLDSNGIIVTFTPNETADAFSNAGIKIEVLPLACSKKISNNIDYEGDIFAEFSDIEYYTPMAGWIKILIWIVAILIVAFLIWFILSRDNMPLGKKTFQRGKINFLGDDAPVSSIKLDSLKGLSFDKYYPQLSDTTLIPFDKRKRNKKKRVAKLICKDTALKISIVNGTFKESFLGSGELYHMDRIEITKQDQNKITLEYTNSKNQRNYGI